MVFAFCNWLVNSFILLFILVFSFGSLVLLYLVFSASISFCNASISFLSLEISDGFNGTDIFGFPQLPSGQVNVGEGVGVGSVNLVQTNLSPDLMQERVVFPTIDLLPTIVHVAPTLSTAREV